MWKAHKVRCPENSLSLQVYAAWELPEPTQVVLQSDQRVSSNNKNEGVPMYPATFNEMK